MIPFFEDKNIVKVVAGARHTLALDHEGNIYAMGDNSEDQCAISGRRANEPEKILKDFDAVDIYAGDSHNIAVSDDTLLFNWGGTVVNQAWISANSNDSKLKLMEDLKRRKISLIQLAYGNTMVITG